MNVLYAGNLDPFGTCYSRFAALRKLEDRVEGFDVASLFDWGRTSRLHALFETHALRGPRHAAANAGLLAKARDFRPDVVWVDKGDWIQPATLRALREAGCFLVSHNTDGMQHGSARVRFKRRLLLRTKDDYDVFFTTNDVDCEALQGGRAAVWLTDLGYDDERFHPEPLTPELREAWSHDLVFAGHYEPHTAAGAVALLEAGLDVRIFGHDDWFKSPERAALGDHLQPRLGNDEYTWALKGARIGLCWVSKANYNQTSARTFEVVGSGTFLLAMRTRGHQESFEEGSEAEFFDGDDELVRKARHYLENEDEREAIAKRGLERCMRSGYSWRAIMERDWQRVLELRDRA